MSVTHPFHTADTRAGVFARRRRRPATPEPSDGRESGVVPGTRTPAGLPRELVVDESGKPRRGVLLAAIMIRRGRSVAEIAAATGLPVDVVTCLSKSV
ncbi:hypothetical protein ACXR2U_11325 [Jatrophihabitans sp. YIM 134969]